MFGLAAGIYQSYFTDPQMNILLIGEEGTGKTCLLERIKVTQTRKNATRLKIMACPAPRKYSAAHMLQEEEVQLAPHTRQESNSSLEDVNLSEISFSERMSETPQQEYNLKPGARMLPLDKVRPTIGMNLAKVNLCGAMCHVWDLGGKMRELWERYYADADAVIFCLTSWDNTTLEQVRSMINDDVPFLVFWHDMGGDMLQPQPTLDQLLPHYHNNMMELFSGSAKTGQGVREALEWLILLAKKQQQLRQGK
jgi:GTPase SAR1 family protein